MKLFRFALLGACALLAAACAKVIEQAPEVPADEPEVTAPVHKITAVIDNDDITKTAYDGETQFGWVAGDCISVIALKDGVSASGYHFGYSADNDGPSSTFTALGTPDWTTYEPSGYAVYPQLEHGWFAGNSWLTAALPNTYTVTGNNFMSIIPLFGVQDESNEDLYHFKTAVGVLKVRLSNVPVTARKLVLTAPAVDTGNAANILSGVFLLNEWAKTSGLAMVYAHEVLSTGNVLTVEFPQQPAGSTITVYIPVPEGTISAGATLSVQTSGGTPIMTTSPTLRDIPITRNVLLDITPNNPISVEEWVSLGTGKFIDNHTFYQAAYWGGAYGLTADDYFDVEIQQHATETNRYRVVNPYGALFADPYNADRVGSGPNGYLTFTVNETLGTGIVVNDSFHTGIKNYGAETELWHDNQYWYGEFYYNNRIINRGLDGSIKNVQLAPHYMGGYDENLYYSPKIEIVFPGAEPMLADHFNYVNGYSVTYTGGKVVANFGGNGDVTRIRAYGSSSSLDDAVAVLEAGTSPDIIDFTASGEVAVNWTPGYVYFLVYKMETEGHGYAYDYRTPEAGVIVPVSAVTVSNDAGALDGSSHYDGSGPGALIDGDTSTYWHSSYDTYTGEYSYYDLDATYGVYIDLDLGESKTVTNFVLRACLRSGATEGFPKHVKVYGSADGTNWGDALAEKADMSAYASAGYWTTIAHVTNPNPIRYIRLSILSNSNDADLTDSANATSACYTHLAEFRILE